MKDQDLIESACSKLDVKRTLPEVGDPVHVNFNLNRDVLSVKAGSGKHRGKVLFYTEAPVHLTGVDFRVQDSIYQQIQEEGARDVCAYVKGTLASSFEPDGLEIRYNPMRQKHFHLDDSTPVDTADRLRLLVREDGTPRMVASGIETLDLQKQLA